MMESYKIGNQHFISGNIEEALHYYSEGVNFASIESNSSEELEIIKLKLLLNRATCFLKNRDYDEAVMDCSKIVQYMSECKKKLVLDSKCLSIIFSKALIRRAIAFEYLGCFSKGIADLDEVLRNDLTNQSDSSLIKQARELRGRLKNLSILDQEVATREGTPSRLVSDSQSLRLSLMSVPPNFIEKETAFNVRLCITNEMGLWDHSLLEAKSSISQNVTTWNRINCSVLVYKNDTFCSDPSFEVAVEHPSKLAENCVATLNSNGKAEFSIRLRETTAPSGDYPPAVMFRFELAGALPSGAEVQPLLSLPIALQHTSISQYTMPSHVNFNCVREVTVQTGETDPSIVYVFESSGFLGIGGKVWDSSYVLLDYLTGVRNELVAGSVVVELGSGTGITGLAVSQLGAARVYVSDLPDVVPLLKANISLNASTSANVSALCYRWGDQDDLTELSTAIYSAEVSRIVIIASDVVYTPDAYEPLLQSIRSLLELKIVDSGGNSAFPVVILSHRHRHPDDGQFFQSLADAPEIEMVDLAYESDKAHRPHKSDDVRVLQITRRISGP